MLRYLAAEVNTHRRARRRRAAPDPIAQVADWLVEMERAVGSSIPLPAGQQGLGEELGLSRVTVNRALSTLAAAGAIQVRLRLINVHNSAYLTTASTSGRDTNTRTPNSRPG